MANSPTDQPSARRQPETTTVQGETQKGVPQMQYERDESGSSQANEVPANQEIGRIAKADQESGRTDTTKGAELDETYQKQREGTPQPNRKFAP